VRWWAVTVRPPRSRANEKLPLVGLWAVLATVPITSAADAEERLNWYTDRWGTEVWHSFLKSGCQIEARDLAAGERLERCLTVYSVIARRVLWAVMLVRRVPKLPCTALLETEE
jgi:hypothetical protein